jgi:hypothetical protein
LKTSVSKVLNYFTFFTFSAMSNRYSRITDSARLRPALDRYVQYLQGTATRPSRINTRGAAPERQEVAIIPFTFTVNTGEKVIVTTGKEDLQNLGATINASSRAQVDSAVSAVTSPLRIPGFKAARVVSFINTSRSVSVATSDVTGLQYLKYNGTRRSVVFGAQTANDDERDAFLDVKARIITANTAAAIKRISLVPEKSQYR